MSKKKRIDRLEERIDQLEDLILSLEAELLAHDACELCGAVIFPWDQDNHDCSEPDSAPGGSVQDPSLGLNPTP